MSLHSKEAMDNLNCYYTAHLSPKEKSLKVQTHYSSGLLSSTHHQDHDLSIGRNWMESIEEYNGPSAYDVLRCDIIKINSVNTSHKVWGQEYHLNRLEQSYRELVTHISMKNSSQDEENMMKNTLLSFDERCLEVAHEESKRIITALLETVNKTYFQKNEQYSQGEDGDLQCEIMRLTLLWTPSADDQNNKCASSLNIISVRGHLSSSGQIMAPYQIPKSIVATLALPSPKEAPIATNKLPDRHVFPYAKISSWSKNRRSLEKKDSFMPEGVGEVLLLLNRNRNSISSSVGTYEILEGLTSNFFAIYRDGTIRTAQEGILFGYVRHLVLQCALKCGLKVDNRPIHLGDGANEEWVETFITSSSRLIYPIRKILIPVYIKGINGEDRDERFHWKSFWTCKREPQESSWYAILREILKCNGY